MKYIVKTFHRIDELETYLNENQIEFEDMKLVVNDRMAILIVRVKEGIDAV